MAVCVSGLQYCQYSQKKISLITLLLDLVLKGWISLSSLMCGCIYHNNVWFHIAKLSS